MIRNFIFLFLKDILLAVKTYQTGPLDSAMKITERASYIKPINKIAKNEEDNYSFRRTLCGICTAGPTGVQNILIHDGNQPAGTGY
jgi:hypothetical protein